jgi:Na+-driven multidrug efflux pump
LGVVSAPEEQIMAFFVAFTLVVLVAVTAYLAITLVRNVQTERRTSNVRNLWGNFGLSFILLTLFLVTWLGQGVAEWPTYREEQRAHNEPVEVSEFIVQFGQSTLENWQSEFLQLFSFVLLSAVLIHRGSAESRDSDDRMERKIDELAKRLDEMGG